MEGSNLQNNESSLNYNQNQLPICQICSMANTEIKCIILHLLDNLRDIEPKQSPNFNMDQNGGFLKLMKIVFYSKCKNFRGTTKCSHIKAQKFFLQSLGINSSTLDKKCNVKLFSMAKYNFHTDTISNQVKSFHRHFASLSQAEILKPVRKLVRKQASPIQTDKTALTQKKIEKQKQKQKQDSNKQPTPVKSQYQMPHYINAPLIPQNSEYFPNPNFNYQHQFFYGNGYDNYINNMMMLGYGYNQPNNNKP